MSDLNKNLGTELDTALGVNQHGDADFYQATYDALKKAMVDAFNEAAKEWKPTVFQASGAALSAYGEIVGIKGPFIVLQAEDAAYPQSDPRVKLEKFLANQRGFIADYARKRKAQTEADLRSVHPGVLAHWDRLIAEDEQRGDDHGT